MAFSNENNFYQGWQKFAVLAIAIIEVIIIIIFILTELGNVASNFWLTNVFAGSWCGLVVLIHVLILFVISCCFTGPKAAFISVIITVVALLAYALLISFDAVFIAQPSTCILTSTCANQSVSTTSFSYNMSQNFFTAFNSLNGFKTYTLSQSKYLFQTVQISFGCLGFVLCLLYLVLYIMARQIYSNQVIPINRGGYNDSPESQSQDIKSNTTSGSRRKLQVHRSPNIPQPSPGELPWNDRRNY